MKDNRLEELSDRIRSGDILSYPLTLEVIQYQEKLKKKRKEKREKLIKTIKIIGFNTIGAILISIGIYYIINIL